MPRFDGTGPVGIGPMTGRGMGPCAWGLGKRLGFGRGMGIGCGWGRGFGCWSCPLCDWFGPKDKKEAKKYYEEYIKAMEEDLEEAKKALGGLDKEE